MAISQEWWDKWWEEDFSWKGLAKKRWEGWVVMDDGRVLPMEDAPGELRKGLRRNLKLPHGFPGRQATLQDYWRDQEDHLISSPDGSVRLTPMHLPLAWRDGSPVDQSLRPDATELNTIIKAKLEVAEETSVDFFGRIEGTDRRAQFRGVVFPNFNLIDLTDRANDLPTTQDEPTRVPLSARFEFAAFSGTAWFANAAFSGEAWFENAAFSGEARFANAAFSGNASFENVAFSGDAWFANAAFSGEAWFNNAAFSGDASFANAAFSGGARFDNAAFSGYTWFNNAAFSGDASFANAAFSGNAGFDNVLFLNGVSFAGQGAELVKPEESHGLEFSQEEAVFKGALKIPRQVTPRARRAFKNGSFENAIFLGDAVITNRDMLDRLSFDNVFFGGAAEFQGSTLHQGVSFFGADFTFVLTSPEGKSFADHFKDNIKHSLNVPGDKTALREWIVSKLKNAPKPGKDTSEHSSRHAQIERAFRKLKLSMEEVRNKIQEQEFYRMELLARRRRRDKSVPWWERQISRLYEAVSDFGGSIMRPLGWLGVLLILIWPVAYLFGLTPDGRDFHFALGDKIDPELWNAFGFSLSNVFPFGPFGETRKEFLDALTPGWKLGVGMLATLHSLASIILVFLSGLAIRRRFQIS